MFGDGLGRAADSSFVTPQPFDVLHGFGHICVGYFLKFSPHISQLLWFPKMVVPLNHQCFIGFSAK